MTLFWMAMYLIVGLAFAVFAFSLPEVRTFRGPAGDEAGYVFLGIVFGWPLVLALFAWHCMRGRRANGHERQRDSKNDRHP